MRPADLKCSAFFGSKVDTTIPGSAHQIDLSAKCEIVEYRVADQHAYISLVGRGFTAHDHAVVNGPGARPNRVPTVEGSSIEEINKMVLRFPCKWRLCCIW